MRKGILLAIAGLALIAGCGSPEDKPGIPIAPKWKGAPYRITFDTKAAPKPNPTGVTIPEIKFTANPEALETRATLVLRFEAAAGSKGPTQNRMIAPPVDIHGEEGALPADYMDRTSKGLSTFLGAYCVKGKVKVSVALARSSLNPQANDSEVDAKRLSDWIPIDLDFKNPHPKC